MAQIIDGKRIAKEIKDKLKEEVSVLKERGTKICLGSDSGRGRMRLLRYM